MPLTPLDAEKAKFRIGFRGYAREEVEHFRAMVLATLEDKIARIQQLDAKVAELESQLDRYREKEELLKNSVVLAQRTCDELIAAAHQRADVITQEAMQEGNRIRQELSELRSQREQFEYAFHGLLTGFKHRLEQGNPQLTATTVRPQLAEGTRASEPEPPAPKTEAERKAASPAAPSAVGAMPAEERRPSAELSSIPDVPDLKRAWEVPPVPEPPARSSGKPSSGTELDRDADIADFSAALDEAPVGAPPWPRQASPPDEDVLDEPVEEDE